MCWINAVYSQARIESTSQDGRLSNTLYLPKSCLKRFHAHAPLQLDIYKGLQSEPKYPLVNGGSKSADNSRLFQPAYSFRDSVRTQVNFGPKLFEARSAMLGKRTENDAVAII